MTAAIAAWHRAARPVFAAGSARPRAHAARARAPASPRGRAARAPWNPGQGRRPSRDPATPMPGGARRAPPAGGGRSRRHGLEKPCGSWPLCLLTEVVRAAALSEPPGPRARRTAPLRSVEAENLVHDAALRKARAARAARPPSREGSAGNAEIPVARLARWAPAPGAQRAKEFGLAARRARRAALPTTPLSQWGLPLRDGGAPFARGGSALAAATARASAGRLLGSAAYAVKAFAVRYNACPAFN